MKLLRLFLASLLLIFAGNLLAQAQIVKCPAPAVAGTDLVVTYNSSVRKATPDNISIDICNAGITTIRLTNAIVQRDSYEPHFIYVGQNKDYFSAKLKKGDNVFYLEAFIKDVKIPAANIKQLAPALNDRIEISLVEDPFAEVEAAPAAPAAQGAAPAAPAAQGAAPAVNAVAAAAATPTPTPAKTKVEIKAPFEVSNQSTYDLPITGKALPPCEKDTECTYNYVIEVQHGTNKRSEKVPILDATGAKITAYTDATKLQSPQVKAVGLEDGTNTISVYAEKNGKKIEGSDSDPVQVKCENCTDYGSSINTRAIVGLEQIGASSAESKSSPFIDFFFNAPFTITPSKVRNGETTFCTTYTALCIAQPINPSATINCSVTPPTPIPAGCEMKPVANICKTRPGLCEKAFKLSVWGNARFSNVPVQRLATLSNFGGFTDSFLGENVRSNTLAQSFDFLVGLEWKFFQETQLSPGFLPGRSSLSLIASAGAVNPLAPRSTAQLFKIPKVSCTPTPPATTCATVQAFKDIFPEAADDKTHIAFASPERDKFFRQYFAGLRIRTNFFDDINKPKNLFPALVDITVGQNEVITKYLRGVIVRLDGSAPLPIKGTNFLYVFGGAQLKLGKRITESQQIFFLEPGTDAGLTSPTTVVVPIDQRTISNRDIFRLGIGIDLFRIFRSQ